MRGDGIIHIHIKEGKLIELNDAIQVAEAMKKLGGGKKYPVLIDCDEFAAVDKEARSFFASKEANIYSAVNAVAYHSFAHKLVADFYVNHNHPQIPTKTFQDMDMAITWLKIFGEKKRRKN